MRCPSFLLDMCQSFYKVPLAHQRYTDPPPEQRRRALSGADLDAELERREQAFKARLKTPRARSASLVAFEVAEVEQIEAAVAVRSQLRLPYTACRE